MKQNNIRFSSMQCDSMRCDAMRCIPYTLRQLSMIHSNTTHTWILCDCCVWVCVCTKLFTNELIFMCTSSISIWFWIRICCFAQCKWINSWNFAIEVLWLDRQAVVAEFFITTSEIKWCLFDDDGVELWMLFDSSELHCILNAYRTTCPTIVD